jgi:hypothetical protein
VSVSRELFRAISSSFPTGVLIVATLDVYYRRTYATWPEERPAPPVDGTG